jgi:hypothetical protein
MSEPGQLEVCYLCGCDLEPHQAYACAACRDWERRQDRADHLLDCQRDEEALRALEDEG